LNDKKRQVSAVEGLFTWPADDPRLVASRCNSCGSIRFPSYETCHNPGCERTDVKEILLSRKGRIYSYTVQVYPPPAPFHTPNPFKPFGIALVELPEGLRVVGMIRVRTSP
jgi:uncharacterized OB-fold protein